MSRMHFGTFWIVIGFAVITAGCGTRSVFLSPVLTPADGSVMQNRVELEVRPVDTSGFGNEERRRLGIDLSAYFTAFELTLRNQTQDTVYFDASDASIAVDGDTIHAALSEEESLSYYETGDHKGGETVLIPKSRAITQGEREKILSLRLKSAEVPSSGTVQGILLFRKISKDQCQQAALVIKGILIAGEDHRREFRFNFNCSGS